MTLVSRRPVVDRPLTATCLVIALLVGSLAFVQPVDAVPGDTTPPVWPVGAQVLFASVTDTSATVSWDAAWDDEAVTGYRVFVDDVAVGTTAATLFPLTGLSPETTYDVRIEAFDEEGNESAPGSGFVLGPRTDVAMGQHPHSVKAEDVDDDGIPDLVVAVAGDDGVSIRLGNGDGTFGAATVYRSGTTPGDDQVYSKNAVVADLDGVGGVDLVVANQNNDSVGVLLGDGDGTFQPVVQYGACNGTHDAAVGEFTGDSALDIIAACHGAATFTLWEGVGDGTFTNRSDLATGASASCATTGRCDHGIAVGDLNGPGPDDVAIAMYDPYSAYTFLGNGDGTFAAPGTYTAGGNTHDIALGDFDEDGDLDMATANESDDSVSIWFNNGSGTFTESAQQPDAANGPKGITVGYLNADAHLDIAVGSDGGNYPSPPPGNAGDFVTVLLGNGDGTFQASRYYGSYTATEGDSVFDVDIADIDGDGRGDLLAANWFGDDVSIWLGADPGGPVAPLVTEPVADGDPPSQVIVTPATGESVTAPAVLSGTASDDTEVAGVTVAIYDIAQGLWWDGGSWGATVARVPATVTGSGTDVTWEYSFAPGSESSFWWAAQATDGAGNVASQTSATFTISSDIDPPSQVIDAPTSGQVVGAPVTLSGTAGDDVGLAGVTVAIYDLTQGLWWDGSTWGAEVTRVPASVSGSGTLETWSLSFDPGLTGSFWWAAQATDTSGNVGSQASSSFTIAADPNPPTQTISAPSPGESVAAPVSLSGSASDDVAVAGVTVAIFDIATGDWWNGSGWQSAVARVPATVTGSGTDVTWDYDFAPGFEGAFWWAARAEDAAGNVASQSSSSFVVAADPNPPTQSISAPSPGESVAAPVSLSGSASDDVAVAGVTVAIFDVSSSMWWDGSGWGSAVVRVPATVTGSGTDVTWEYSFAPGIESSFWWAAQATDASGNVGSQSSSSFGIVGDPHPPSQVILTPGPGESVAAPVVLSGSASDDVEVAGVTVAIFDVSSSMWWDGSGWGSAVVRVPATVIGSGTEVSWEYPFDPGLTGGFWWAARATDTYGNVGSQSSSSFVIDGE